MLNDETGNVRFKSWSHSGKDVSHFTAKKETSPPTNGRINTISFECGLALRQHISSHEPFQWVVSQFYTCLQYSLKIIHNR